MKHVRYTRCLESRIKCDQISIFRSIAQVILTDEFCRISLK